MIDKRHKVLLLGKLPPPYMGPAIATKILLGSSLKDCFHLLHLDTRINTSLNTMGKWSIGKVMKNLGNYWKLLRLNTMQRPSLVLIPISQTTMGYLKDFVFMFLCKMTGRNVVLQLRGSNFKNWLDQASFLTKTIVRISMKWSSGMIVLGHNLTYLFKEYYPDDRIFVIPNGGNFHFPSSEKKDDTVRFLFLSNLFDAKGIRDVMDAVKILKSTSRFPFHLDVAGSWLEEPTREYCLRLADEEQLPVTFHSPVAGEDKLKRFATADVFIFTPREPEGHPWVLVEAMAAALPIIATDKGAITESVSEGENGFIVKDRSPEEIAARMQQLGSDASLRKKMSVKSFEFYQTRFTEERMAENYKRCFEVLIGKDRHD